MRIIIRSTVDPQREIDVTHCLVAAIAEELWRLYGGNEQLNWLEAELNLQRIVGKVRAAAGNTGLVRVAQITSAGVYEPAESPDSARRRGPRHRATDSGAPQRPARVAADDARPE